MKTAKVMAFLRATSARERSALQSFCLSEFAPQWMAGDASVSQLFVDVVGPVPENMPWRRPGEASAVPDEQPYDAVIEAWFATREQARAAAERLADSLAGKTSRLDLFITTEFIEKDRPTGTRAGRSPGLKYIGLCSFHDDLPASAAKRSWDVHVKLALEVHVGMARYVRNWVDEGVRDESGEVRGIVELHFDRLEDLQHRWFESERGQREIVQDVGHFLKGAVRMFAVEHVLKVGE